MVRMVMGETAKAEKPVPSTQVQTPQIVPEESPTPPEPTTPTKLVNAAGRLLRKHEKKGTPYDAGTLRTLARELDDDVLRAVGFTAKDDAALFQIAQVLEAFVGDADVKDKQDDEIIASEHLTFVPKLLKALKEAIVQLLEKRKGNQDPVHAQAEEIAMSAPARPATPPPRRGGQAGGRAPAIGVHTRPHEIH